LAALAAGTCRLVLEPDGAVTLAAAARGAHSVALVVGPEGGISPTEQAWCVRAGFVACRLGPRILRTETAPLAALAILQASAGDLG
jgi:16S rRNA (uracil1498-N3)-methyltransferase